LTVARILAIACNDSRIQAKPLNEDSSAPRPQKFRLAVIVLLVSTSGSYIVFTPDQLHHLFSKMEEELHFKLVTKRNCGCFLLNT
jgi:hypothetical protein